MRGLLWIVSLLPLTGCNPELLGGTYEVELVGTSNTLDGTNSDFSNVVEVAIAQSADRAHDRYDIRICEGLTQFFTTNPCFYSIEAVEGRNSFSGSKERPWTLEPEDADLFCQGFESVVISGDINRDDTGTLQLDYVLSLDESSSSGCLDYLAERDALISGFGDLLPTASE